MIKPKLNLIKFTAGIFFALQVISATAILSCPLPALAQSTADSVNSLQFTPQVTIPNSNFNNNAATNVGTYNTHTGKIDSTLLAQYIGAIYNYGLTIAGILATIMLMAAGIIWLTSGGDSGKVTQAKELISGSIAGLIILIVSWVILNTINPDLVNLKAVSTKNLTKIDISYLVCCSPTTGEIKYPIKIVNGKKIATDGSLSGKEIKCSGQSVECDGDKFCNQLGPKEFKCEIKEEKTAISSEKINFRCCEYGYENELNSLETIRICRTIPMDGKTNCPEPPTALYKTKYITSYDNYSCGNVEIKADSCKLDCTGKKDGEKCGDTQDNYCYSGSCWLNKGELGEPCGTDIGAKCVKGRISCPGSSKHSTGGRNCNGGTLRCCY